MLIKYLLVVCKMAVGNEWSCWDYDAVILKWVLLVLIPVWLCKKWEGAEEEVNGSEPEGVVARFRVR